MVDRKGNPTKISILILVLFTFGYFGVMQLRKTSPLFNFLFSPGDLYEPLACTEFDLSKTGEYTLSFQNQYPGNHRIEILVDNPPAVAATFHSEFKLNIKITDIDTVILDKTLTQPGPPFWRADGEGGFVALSYHVPKDLPRGQKLKASIEIETPDEAFLRRYGEQTLCIRKFSDE